MKIFEKKWACHSRFLSTRERGRVPPDSCRFCVEGQTRNRFTTETMPETSKRLPKDSDWNWVVCEQSDEVGQAKNSQDTQGVFFVQ